MSKAIHDFLGFAWLRLWLWLIQKARTTFSTNQIQNENQSFLYIRIFLRFSETVCLFNFEFRSANDDVVLLSDRLLWVLSRFRFIRNSTENCPFIISINYYHGYYIMIVTPVMAIAIITIVIILSLFCLPLMHFSPGAT